MTRLLLPQAVTYILRFIIGCYGLIILIDLFITRAIKRCIIEAIFLIMVVLLLYFTTGFPLYKMGFGGTSFLIAIVIIFICTVLGMMARYVFYQGEKFSWGSFLRPLVISPLILLPLIGTMQGIQEFEAVQLISFGVLSFQNGFFWREVFKKVRKEAVQQHENPNE